MPHHIAEILSDEHPTDRADASWIVRLSGAGPIAEGRESLIFERPGKASQLIKVRKVRQGPPPGVLRAFKKRVRTWLGIESDRTLLRQSRAYLEAAQRCERLLRPPPLAHLRGMLLTDMGLGIVVQKIRDENGNLAPTVGDIVERSALDPAMLRSLMTDFAREMSAFKIAGYDLNLGNLVYETRRGRSRIVLIDGYGSRSAIPLRRWFRRFNDWKLARQFHAMAHRIDSRWDAGVKAFLEKE